MSSELCIFIVPVTLMAKRPAPTASFGDRLKVSKWLDSRTGPVVLQLLCIRKVCVHGGYKITEATNEPMNQG